MRPEDRDTALLWDMREAAREILEFTQNVEVVRFSSDKNIPDLLRSLDALIPPVDSDA